MLITPKSISPLARFITGDISQTPYLSGPKLIDLFNQYGFDDKYGRNFPSSVRDNPDDIVPETYARFLVGHLNSSRLNSSPI